MNDRYEYRVGYQYKDGRVGHSQEMDWEPEAIERLAYYQFDHGLRNFWLLPPWLERRRILEWSRWVPTP